MPLQNYILDNFKWKMLSIVLAALTWLTVHGSLLRDQAAQQSAVVATVSQTAELSLVPIRLIVGPENTNRFRLKPDTVTVKIGGKPEDLKKLQIGEVQAYVDVSSTEDEKQFRRPVQVGVPREFSVELVDPTNVSVERITGSLPR